MSTSRTDTTSELSTATPTPSVDAADVSGAEEVAHLPPMLREPTRLPGQARRQFSPEQFYALSRVVRTDVSATDDALWLTQETCPTINPEGILFEGVLYWDLALQGLVDVGTAAPKRSFVIRYNRALFARGVLDEIVILEQDAAGGYRERCRCRPRDEVPEIDLNQVIAERERLIRVLTAKKARSHELQITLEKGTKALEELRDEQARQRRLQRRTKRPPVAAAPIDPQSAREEQQARASAQVFDMSARLKQATVPTNAAPTAADSGSERASSTPTDPQPPRHGRRKTAGARPASTRAAQPPAALTSGSDARALPTGHEPAGTPTLSTSDHADAFDPTPRVMAGPDLTVSLGGQTGFVPLDDE